MAFCVEKQSFGSMTGHAVQPTNERGELQLLSNKDGSLTS